MSSNVEVFKRSVAIAEFITEAQAKGLKILIQGKDGTIQELIMG